MKRQIGQFQGEVIHQALAALGAELGAGHGIEILIVGGAAALLIGVLPPTITTGDVDAIHFRPPNDVEEVLIAAEAVADKQQLAKGWLSIDAGLYANAVPEDWESRRVDIGRFGRLQVYALGRLDLIATKFYAHREVDLEHLARMSVTLDERRFANDSLQKLYDILPDERGKIDMALHILGEWT
jgi:nucleotide-binding universal stress UspA family protein